MTKRPLCLVLLLLTIAIWVADWLGISWIWRSPAGKEPFELAAASDIEPVVVAVEGTVCRQESKTYQENQTITYLYLKQSNLYINSKKYPVRTIKCKIEGMSKEYFGCRLRVRGNLILPRQPGNPGEFDRVMYERSRKTDFYLENIDQIDTIAQAGKLSLYMEKIRKRCISIISEIFPQKEAGVIEAMLMGDKENLDEEIKSGFQAAGISHVMAISGVKTLKLDIPLVPETSIKWALMPLHIAKIYILKLCLDEEIIPRCRFPCSRGYLTKCINQQKKQ